MAINWTTVETNVEAEIDDKLEERCQALTDLMLQGITEFKDGLTLYDVSDADQLIALADFFGLMEIEVDANGWPAATDIGEQIPTATRTTIRTSIETEVEENIVTHVDNGVSDKYPAVEEA
jgi:hypothetical protein